MNTETRVTLETEMGIDPNLPAHIVRQGSMTALCGYQCSMELGKQAPGRDRCLKCLEIARDRGFRVR